MDELREALGRAAETIAGYREGLAEARVASTASRDAVRRSLGELPDGPTPLEAVVAELVEKATPGAGSRTFSGFRRPRPWALRRAPKERTRLDSPRLAGTFSTRPAGTWVATGSTVRRA